MEKEEIKSENTVQENEVRADGFVDKIKQKVNDFQSSISGEKTTSPADENVMTENRGIGEDRNEIDEELVSPVEDETIDTDNEKKIEEKFKGGDGRKLKLAMMAYENKDYDEIEKEVSELAYSKIHFMETQNEVNLLLGINLECGNC